MKLKLLSAMLLAFSPLTLFAKNLVVCTEASPDGFDVVQYNSLVTTNASADVIFDSLVKYDEVSKSVVPSVAKAWSVSDDGLVYTFELNDNVAFHTTEYFTPSRTLNADDVLFSFQRMLDENHPWHKIAGPNGFPHAQSLGLVKLVKSIDKTGDKQITFTLNEPNATFLSLLTMGFTSIYSAEYADKLAQENRFTAFNSEPIGTGPFIFKKYTKDADIRYVANEQYFAGKPGVEQLIYAITPDAAVRAQKLKANECQIALSPKPNDVISAEESGQFAVSKVPAFMTAFIALNTEKAPLDNVKVRQALNYAFDQPSYLKAVFEGTATNAVNPYPANTWSFNTDIQPYTKDINKAKALLAEAGLPNGFKTTLWVRPNGSVLNPNPKLGAELLQADLKAIGVDAEINIIEWGELIQSAKQGEHQMLFMGWAGDNGDPDNFLTPQFSCDSVKSGINFARFCDEKLDNLIQQGKKTSDIPTRISLYKEAQQIIHDQALWIPLAHPTAATLLDKSVQGFTTSQFGRLNFSKVSVQ